MNAPAGVWRIEQLVFEMWLEIAAGPEDETRAKFLWCARTWQDTRIRLRGPNKETLAIKTRGNRIPLQGELFGYATTLATNERHNTP